MARNYSNTYPGGTLAGGISSGATSITLSSASGLPVATPYTLTIDDGSPSMEVVEVVGQSGVNLTVMRGIDGTSAVAHGLGATVTHSHTARDFREPALHAEAAAAHGATGAVVGTTNAQTLTSKTLSAASNSVEGFTPNRFVTSDGSGRAAATQTKGIPAGAVVGTSDTQLLTNKTLTSPVIDGNVDLKGQVSSSAGAVEVNDALTVTGLLTSQGFKVPIIQVGSGSVGLGGLAGVNASVAFGSAFPGTPTVVAMSHNALYTCALTSANASGATIAVRHTDSTATSATVSFSWIAVYMP